jgi:hypothetical protein
MLQTSVSNVSSVFSDGCCKTLDVAYVSYVCCKCFIWMLRMFVMVSNVFQLFLQVFQKACFKSRSGVTSPSSPSATLHTSHTVEGVWPASCYYE